VKIGEIRGKKDRQKAVQESTLNSSINSRVFFINAYLIGYKKAQENLAKI